MTIDREKLAWAAGLFEGEGYFSAPKANGRVCSVTAGINGFTDRPVLEQFMAAVQMGRILGPYHRVSPMSGKPQKPSYQWIVCSFEETQALVALLWGWLGARRRSKALEVLGAFLAKENRTGKRRGTIRPIVPEIKRLLREGKRNYEVVKVFDCSPATVSAIASGKIYADIL